MPSAFSMQAEFAANTHTLCSKSSLPYAAQYRCGGGISIRLVSKINKFFIINL